LWPTEFSEPRRIVTQLAKKGALNMATSQRRMIELALLGLETEQRSIEQERADLREQLNGTNPASPRSRTAARATTAAPPTAAVGHPAPNKGKKMSAAQKKKISLAMKARYAAKKKAA